MHSFGSSSMLAILMALVPISAWADDRCAVTPRQTEGPYYPPKAQREAQADTNNDLTRIGGQPGQATGQIIYVTGQVRDRQCRPIAGAIVEIWQASENGRYRHPRDRDNPAPLDPNFQYWGKMVTDPEGRYRFKTIKPGAYQAGPRWMRPPHVHVKVTHPDFGDFITQLYFAGDPYQDKDRILQTVPDEERERVVVHLEEPGVDDKSGAKVARFDLTLP